MPFCSNCGKEVEPGVKFCPHCGAPQGAAAQSPPAYAPTRASGPSRPPLAGLFFFLYLTLGIFLLFFGGSALVFSSFFTFYVIIFAMLVFVGNGVLSFLSAYGFLKGGRLASRYIAVSAVCCIVGGILLALSASVSLDAVGGFSALVGLGSLAYLRFGNAKDFLSHQ